MNSYARVLHQSALLLFQSLSPNNVLLEKYKEKEAPHNWGVPSLTYSLPLHTNPPFVYFKTFLLTLVPSKYC